MSGDNPNQPAQRVSISNGRVRLYDAVGVDSEKCDWFVRHVGLSLDEVKFAKGESLQVRMVDMGPPLVDPKTSESKSVDVVGTAELSADDASIIATFICEQQYEYESLKANKFDQYYVFPHFVERVSKDTVRRYSCAGFVYECYKDVDITLVDIMTVPSVSIEPLKMAFPDQQRNLDRPERRKKFGLTEDGPWPVLLPGYLFHSLNRDADEIRRAPYQVKPGDECFPRRESAELAKVDT